MTCATETINHLCENSGCDAPTEPDPELASIIAKYGFEPHKYCSVECAMSAIYEEWVRTPSPRPALTAVQAAALWMDGHGVKSGAAALGVAPQTVQGHLRQRRVRETAAHVRARDLRLYDTRKGGATLDAVSAQFGVSRTRAREVALQIDRLRRAGKAVIATRSRT